MQKSIGDLVGCFWDSVYYALVLSEKLHELVRVKGRSQRKQLRLLLALIYEGPLAGQFRQVKALRRDIPRLIEELGGDPSEELLFQRRQRPPQREPQMGTA
jgi:hypothetical protein